MTPLWLLGLAAEPFAMAAGWAVACKCWPLVESIIPGGWQGGTLASTVGVTYRNDMVTLHAHFDGKAIVPDEPFSLPFPSGTRLKVSIEPVEEARAATSAPRSLQPLNIQIDPELSNAIALDPAFNIEES